MTIQVTNWAENSHDTLSFKPISKEFIDTSSLTHPVASVNGGGRWFYSHEWYEKHPASNLEQQCNENIRSAFGVHKPLQSIWPNLCFMPNDTRDCDFASNKTLDDLSD